jgi:hypothetical protein
MRTARLNFTLPGSMPAFVAAVQIRALTLARNELRFAGTPVPIPVLTEPTTRQKQAFDLIGAATPLTLGK